MHMWEYAQHTPMAQILPLFSFLSEVSMIAISD